MRLFRIWFDLEARKHAGFGHNTSLATNQQPGSLVLFCPACPQPGINLPDGWNTDPDAKWKYGRVINIDGNFKADHLAMHTPDDLSLSDGLGFFVGSTLYKKHIETAQERQVCILMCFKDTFYSITPQKNRKNPPAAITKL